VVVNNGRKLTAIAPFQTLFLLFYSIYIIFIGRSGWLVKANCERKTLRMGDRAVEGSSLETRGLSYASLLAITSLSPDRSGTTNDVVQQRNEVVKTP